MLYRIHRIFLDFFHRPVFQKTWRFGNWICFRPQVKVGEKTPTQLGPLEKANLNHCSKGPNWVGVFSPTFTWGRKQIQLPKCHVFLEYRTMKKVQKNSVNSVQHAPSSESFQVYLMGLCLKSRCELLCILLLLHRTKYRKWDILVHFVWNGAASQLALYTFCEHVLFRFPEVVNVIVSPIVECEVSTWCGVYCMCMGDHVCWIATDVCTFQPVRRCQ
jgi:hypothetical protein